jgi:hypothetical protein
MVAPLIAMAKAYAVNKAKDAATSKAEEMLGLPKDTIGAVTNPAGFATGVVKDVAKNYAKDAFFGKDEIPEEDRSFTSSDPKKEIETYADNDLDAYKRGGKVKTSMKSTAKAASASRRGDGIAQRGKTKGRYL